MDRKRMQKNLMAPLSLAEVSLFEGRRRRTVYEIYAEILQICQKPESKTRIMYRTNTSYTYLMRYLEFLQKVGLLQPELFNRNRLQTTERGRKFVEKYREILQLIDENYPSIRPKSPIPWLY